MLQLPNEEILVYTNEHQVVLTDHRIQMSERGWAGSYSINIFLEDISTIETKYKDKVLFLILSGISFGIGVFFMKKIMLGLLLTAIFFALWWLTRKYAVSVTSHAGVSLSFFVQGMGESEVDGFVNNVLAAKQKRQEKLNRMD